jgi:hypothetical protein
MSVHKVLNKQCRSTIYAKECEKQMKNFRFNIIYLIRTKIIALSNIKVLANIAEVLSLQLSIKIDMKYI